MKEYRRSIGSSVWTNCICFVFLGSWWNLSKVPNDLWRLCKEKDPQRKGRLIFFEVIIHNSVRLISFIILQGFRFCNIFYRSLASFIFFVLQYVDHIKYCSKFKAPCRFHVVGCDTSVSRHFCHNLLFCNNGQCNNYWIV